MAIQEADAYEPAATHLKIFITSDFGMGKSVFGTSFPGPAHVFNFDRKILTYKGTGFSYSEYPLTPQGWIEYEKDQREIVKQVKEGKLKSVLYESITAMQDLAMERALSIDPKRSETNGPLWNVHYQIVKNLMAPRLREAVSMKCNIMMSAHFDIKYDQKTGNIIKIDPKLVGDLSTVIPGYFEEVYCAFTRDKPPKYQGGPPEVEYYLRTVPRGYFKARSTLSGVDGLLPPEIIVTKPINGYQAVLEAYQKGVAKRAAAKKE